MNMIPPKCADNARIPVGKAAEMIGMSRRRFYDYLEMGEAEGGCRFTLPRHGTRKIIYGKWLKDFYFRKMGALPC